MNDTVYHQAAEGRELARQREIQVRLIAQDFRPGGLRMAAIQTVGAYRAWQARFVEYDIHARDHIWIVGAVYLAHSLPPLWSRQSGRHEQFLHFGVCGAAIGHHAEMDRPLGLFLDF